MLKRQLLKTVLILLVAPGSLLAFQDRAQGVRVVGASPVDKKSVALQLAIFSKAAPILIPACGQDDNSAETPCVVELQTRTAQGWRRAPLRHKGVKLGAWGTDVWKERRVAAGKEEKFAFVFSKELFAVESGQRLRVVVEAWTNERAMKTGSGAMRLTSPPFVCP